MRDKLVKYHHKAVYYRLRKVALIMFFVVLTTAVIAIPISIMSVAARENESCDKVSCSEPESSDTVSEMIRFSL